MSKPNEICKNCHALGPGDVYGVKLCPVHAAAPDLLEACRYLREWMHGDQNQAAGAEGMRKLGAAIAKAEG